MKKRPSLGRTCLETFEGDIQDTLSVTELVPILQYANGTLNIVKTNRKELKQVLDMFSTITRFHINFDKNTFVPMSTYH